MKILIYDLSSSYEVRVIESENNSKILAYKMPPALIKDDSLHNNSKCSLFDPDNPDFSAFIKMRDGEALRFEYDNAKLLTLTEIMYSLCWNKIQSFTPMENYFKAVGNLVNAILKKKALTVGLTILLVPDALPLESQQRLLSYFGRNKTRLLWHSVAISLGNEELLKKCEDKARVAIVDEFSNVGFFTSQIEIKKEKDRAIPCHKIYQKADGKISEWYDITQKGEIDNAIREKVRFNRLTAAYRLHNDNEFVTIDRYSSLPVRGKEVVTFRVRTVRVQRVTSLVISSEHSDVYGPFESDIDTKCNIRESGFAGAVRFYEYVRDNQIPYYDECESFSVICQNKKEEIEYFELVKANPYLPAGRKTEGIKISNLYILKNNTEAKFKFHLGDINNNNVQLRQYTQKFPIEKALEEDRALLFSPSVIPGQGYAEVLIEDNNPDKLFPPIELDWKHMELAFENGEKVTKAYLEKHLERSFPPDVPPVRTRYLKDFVPWGLNYDLSRLIERRTLFFEVPYNRSRWPYIADKDAGVEKFTRENVFGHYTPKDKHEYAFPVRGISITGAEFLDVFEELAKQFVNIGGTDPNYITWLAWCYQRYDLRGELLPWMKKATDLIIGSIDNFPKYPLRPQTATFIANMIATEKEFERVFCVFDRMLSFKKVGINNWCRAVYQMLMYTPYIYSDNKKIGDAAVSIMDNLTTALRYAAESFSVQRVYMTLRVILYMLRRRICEKTFCKKESSDGLYVKVVDSLGCVEDKLNGEDNLKFCPYSKQDYIRELVNSIRKFLDGKGVLDGIPVPGEDDGNDGGSDDE